MLTTPSFVIGGQRWYARSWKGFSVGKYFVLQYAEPNFTLYRHPTSRLELNPGRNVSKTLSKKTFEKHMRDYLDTDFPRVEKVIMSHWSGKDCPSLGPNVFLLMEV